MWVWRQAGAGATPSAREEPKIEKRNSKFDAIFDFRISNFEFRISSFEFQSQITNRQSPIPQNVIFQVTVRVSFDTSEACVKVFSKHNVPLEEALNMPAAWAAWVPVAVKVFDSV